MDFNSIFSNIAQLEGGIYSFEEYDYLGGMHRGKVFSTRHRLVIDYRDVKIQLDFELGHQDFASLKFQLPKQMEQMTFHLSTVNSFWQFFNRRLSPLVIAAKNEQLKNCIELNQNYIALIEEAKIDKFEPTAHGENNGSGFSVEWNFHLLLKNKTNAILPLIRLNKSLIDFYLNKRYISYQ